MNEKDKLAVDFLNWFWWLPNKEEIVSELSWEEILKQYYVEKEL